MPGGKFDKSVGKTRPGTYTNFESGKNASAVGAGSRGTTIVPLPRANYGPAKQFIKLTNSNPDAAAAILGYSVYDDDPNRQMLLIREAFKRANTVYAYILGEGKKATAQIKMALADVVASSEVDTAVLEAISQYVGAKDGLTGCTLSYSKRNKTMSVTLTAPLAEVKNTGLFEAMAALTKGGSTVTIEGTTITGLADFKKTAAYEKLATLTEGGSTVSVQATIGKDGTEETYTIAVAYPAGGMAVAASASVIAADSDNVLTASAKYGGSRGNEYTVTVDANPVGGYDVLIHLGGSKVWQGEALHTVEELVAMDNPYLDFKGEGDLGPAVGQNLSGGTDEEITNGHITDFVDAWEGVKFDTVAFPFDGKGMENVKQAARTKIKYMRENMGKGVTVAIPNASGPDYEGVINVTNSVALDDYELTTAEACAWVAAAEAACTMTQALTHVAYDGAVAVVNPKDNEEAIAAIKAGEFFFTVDDDGAVIVESDINSLTSYGTQQDKKDKNYTKNRVIRVLDTLQATLQATFPPNKFDNNPKGWEVMDGICKAILRQFEDEGAIKNVDYDNDLKVNRQESEGDETYFDGAIQPVDSSEKLYFSIKTR